MTRTRQGTLSAFALLTSLAMGAAQAAELPANFPGDVPVADYMVVVNVMQVGDDMKVDLHAPGQSLADVVEWFQSGLTSQGWTSDGESINERSAILAFSKGGRRCGVNITNFILNESMQMDESIKGVGLLISAADAPSDDGAAVSSSMSGDVQE